MKNDQQASTPALSRRALVASGGAAAAAGLLAGRAAGAAPSVRRSAVRSRDIALEIYHGFANDELHRWDAVIHRDVRANSPAGRGIEGLATLKRFNKAFLDAFRPRTDLIDHYVAGDRGLVTVNLHWKHDGGPFNGIAPTGKSGTSVETFLLRIAGGMVTHWDVADNSLDLANYLHDQRMTLPTFVEPPALIRGRPLGSDTVR
jgi:hypothetical protein